jgi:hypothetical protein
MRLTRVVVVSALVACGGGASSTPPVSPNAAGDGATNDAKPVPPPPCITPPEDTATIRHATGDAERVSYCIGAAIDQCFALDLTTGKLARLDGPPTAQPRALDAAVRVETTTPDLKVCDGAGCKSLANLIFPGAAPLRAASNGVFAAVLLGAAEKGQGFVDVYEVAKIKKLARFRYARGEFRCGEIAMLGETIYVGANVCARPSGRAALYTSRGRRIALVGGKDFGTFGDEHTQIDERTWAFLEENGNKIAVQDVIKGKVLKTIDVGELFGEGGGPRIGNPGESAIIRLGPDKLAVIAGTPANGSTAVVDVSTGDIQIFRAPFCD